MLMHELISIGFDRNRCFLFNSNVSLCFRFDFISFLFVLFSFSFHINRWELGFLPEIYVRVATYAVIPTVYFSPEMYAKAFASAIPAPFLAAMTK